jgi:hypothetical protein
VTFEEALDELYGASLADFVAERKRLAKELDREDAAAFAKVRKPTAAAWTLNQLARSERRDVDLLLDAGHRLRQAGLDKTAVERARTAEIDALKRLHTAAARLGASGQTLARVDEALRAAAVTEEGRAQLALGRFVEPPTASVGFEAYAGMPVPKRKPNATRRATAASEPKPSAELRAAEKRLDMLRSRLEALEAEVAAAEQRVRELRG